MADQEEEVTGPAEPGPVTAEMTEEEAQLEADMAALLQQRDDALDAARRVQADFENYRKRVLREQTALVGRSTSGLRGQCVPVRGRFALAVVNLDSNDVDIEKVRKGVDLVFAEFLGVL